MMNRIKARAIELLSDGTVNRVIGWEKGEGECDWTPALFENAEEMNAFVYGKYAGANLSKYCLKFNTQEGKTLVVLKPCDTLSFRQLVHEHRINREKFYIIGAGCKGMHDENGLLIKCAACKGKDFEIYDEIIDDEDSREVIQTDDRMAEVKKIEMMTAEERFEFWRGELSRCIRCNACRNVCPACSCEKCVFDNPQSGVQNKAAASSFEENMFHIIRAFHVASRCTDCGECSRVCPQRIPLHLLNRKFIKDINELYGTYQAGADMDTKPALMDFTFDDCEPSVVHTRGGDR